ncbi:MAG TPA: 50S ribosomal protein L25/general stress protein Ctc [Rhizomicrobium sp.]|jgi:large subunit ribosomal protein L25|nr:50S ribosomal protein L25/general stress protein Ctc [Rhizomicrobium sp.]
MRELQELGAEPREGTGKGHAFRTRSKGRVPGIVYGGKDSPELVSVDFRTLERHVAKATFLTTPFLLAMADSKLRVIPRAVQTDPVNDRPVHVDFLRLPEGARVNLDIPVRFKGQENSPGIKRGGVLNIVRHEVKLLCPAENIPEFIEGDLSALDIHGSLHLDDFTLPEGVKPTLRERDFTVASIVAPTSVIEEQRAAAAAAKAGGGAAEAEAPAAGAAPAGAAAPAAGAAAPAKAGAAAPAKAGGAPPAKPEKK